MKLHINRYSHEEKQTIGKLFVLNNNNEVKAEFDCLELPWKNNQQNISCIPEGIYQVKKRTSPKFGEHFHVLNVPGRSYILIHKGNYYTDIRGCILPGLNLSDVNRDGVIDVTNSTQAMAQLLKMMGSEFQLKITSK
ncbi:DUF5675 family protein [Mesonia aestuariivivens]|uniref:DUF5675 domain-containing protein n=1 Tax=Mesonia aestuariivivens TaxID=2796128 RepID=A0ABS6W3D2_9FLAO|nr:DUF5675 family protein [Mesonia aestuariivivens]MBW2962319.1 hypothetical protein [Mesonia aestuariivivens]